MTEILMHLPVYLAIFIPILGSVLIVSLRLLRPGFRGLWFIGILFSIMTGVAVFLSRSHSSHLVPLMKWGPESILPFTPILLVDAISWPYAVGMAVLLMAVILTAAARLNQRSWRAWAGNLGLAGLGLVGVLSGSPLTLLLSWSAIDLLELTVELFQVSENTLRGGIVQAFSARLAGSFAFILAVLFSQSIGVEFSFNSIPPQVGFLVLIAAGLRLGVLPVRSPLLQEIPMRRGMGTYLRFTSAATSLMLLARTASVSFSSGFVNIVLGLVCLAAVFSAISWFLSENELSGRPFWMLGFASLAVASAVNGSVNGVMAWGLGLIFSGAVLFLYSARHITLSVLLLIGLAGASGLPFTPTWQGMTALFPVGAESLWKILFSITLFISLVILLLGYLKHTYEDADQMAQYDPWVWVVYPTGLILLLAAYFGLGWLYLPDLGTMDLTGWLAGPAAFALVIGLDWLRRRRTVRLPGLVQNEQWGTSFWGQLLSLAWVYRFFWWLYQIVSRFLYAVTQLQEGEGGILWAFLILLLILSLTISGLPFR